MVQSCLTLPLGILRGISEKNGTPELTLCHLRRDEFGEPSVGRGEVTSLVPVLSLLFWCLKSAFGHALSLYFALFLGLIAIFSQEMQTEVHLYNCD